MRQSTVLVVDDEKEIADVVELYLQNDQYKVFKFYNGQDALDCINSTKIDLAILDIMLPDIDGFQILKQIRQKYTFPVIMLTAKTEYMDKITGLTLGADDYIPKPFNPLELVARVKAQLRRCTQYNEGTKEEGDVLDFGGLLLNRTSHECVYNEVPLTLTRSFASRLESGSSIRKTFWSFTIALPSATLCLCPPDKFLGLR